MSVFLVKKFLVTNLLLVTGVIGLIPLMVLLFIDLPTRWLMKYEDRLVFISYFLSIFSLLSLFNAIIYNLVKLGYANCGKLCVCHLGLLISGYFCTFLFAFFEYSSTLSFMIYGLWFIAAVSQLLFLYIVYVKLD